MPSENPPRASEELETPPGVVVLMSGGLDSAVMAGLAVEAGEVVWPLYVRQGYLWEAEELTAARSFLAALRPRDGRLHPIVTGELTFPQAARPDWAVSDQAEAPGPDSADSAVYLPGRNLALLAQAALLARAHGLRRIQLGILKANPFPDATESFRRAFEAAAGLAIGSQVRVETPLAAWDKAEVIRRGAGLPLAATLSCLRPRGGAHCGRCNKCAERRRAFARAGVPDPTSYAGP